MNNIHDSIKHLSVDIETLSNLDGNPRKGNVSAIAAAYSQFGQVKPIVVWRDDESGQTVVIAGNHQLKAAKSLGWSEIACIEFAGSRQEAISYALADNRTVELGHTDNDLLNSMLLEVVDVYPELWEDLGWDEFELAQLDSATSAVDANSTAGSGAGFIAPVIVNPPPASTATDEFASLVTKDARDGESKIIASEEMDHSEIAVKGSTVAVPGAAPRAVVQYTIVFDSPDQQKHWYEFVKWLRANPSIDGNTTAERLLNFVSEHCEI